MKFNEEFIKYFVFGSFCCLFFCVPLYLSLGLLGSIPFLVCGEMCVLVAVGGFVGHPIKQEVVK